MKSRINQNHSQTKTRLSKHIFLSAFLVMSVLSWSQPVLKRNGNSTLSFYHATHPQWNSSSKLNKWQRKDTLKLPFFDDFVSTRVYPDSTRWYTNYVFINNDFPVKPPSYGVATFDDLDSKGNPYHELNDQTYGACDTLLSLAINLKDSSGKIFTIADSIYFSFYFQRQGLGDPSDDRDSLILEFKDSNGTWKTMWKVKGGSVAPFSFVMIGINETKYLFKGFQFRFINFARHTGNMNQWHVDYIHLARNRKKAVNYYDDIAIQSQPTSLLKYYYQMPYDHFLADPANQKADTIYIYASNLDTSLENVQARHVESNGANILVSTIFNQNNDNIPGRGNARRIFQSFSLNSLTSAPNQPKVVKREYEIGQQSGSKNAANDKLTTYQEFGSCYAYDDGTSEYGFGYDDDVIDQFYKGAIAYRFNLVKQDSLWAIGMFFNRSVKSSSLIKFNLKVWKKISPVGKGRGADEPILTIPNLTPKFTDSMNGYYVFIFDTAKLLPKGDFYIGWEQTGNYHLDVGWDMNNGYNNSNIHNNLFFLDVIGNWQEYPSTSIGGALMMRPYVGKKIKLGPVNSVQKTDIKTIACYPNPFTDIITVDQTKAVSQLRIFDLSGKLINESFSNELDMSLAQPGIYTLQVTTENGEIYHQKMVKLHH